MESRPLAAALTTQQGEKHAGSKIVIEESSIRSVTKHALPTVCQAVTESVSCVYCTSHTISGKGLGKIARVSKKVEKHHCEVNHLNTEAAFTKNQVSKLKC